MLHFDRRLCEDHHSESEKQLVNAKDDHEPAKEPLNDAVEAVDTLPQQLEAKLDPDSLEAGIIYWNPMRY